MKKYTQLPDELDLQGYPGSDFIIPFRLEGITGHVSMRSYQVVNKITTEMAEALRPVISQAEGALTGTITISGNQTAQYENLVCTHALFVNGTIYGAGDLLFSRITDEATNTTEPLVLSAGASQSITITALGALPVGTLKQKPIDFRTVPAVHGQPFLHGFDCDHIVSEAFNSDATPNLEVKATPQLINGVLDRNNAVIYAPGGFTGVLYIIPYYLTA